MYVLLYSLKYNAIVLNLAMGYTVLLEFGNGTQCAMVSEFDNIIM